MNRQLLEKLIQNFIQAKNSGELGDEQDYNDRMEGYRKWLLENILDYDKLTHYSDAEFAQKFGEMFDHTDGSASSHGLTRGMHFNTTESRLAVRNNFENLIAYITNPDNDRFELLETALDPKSPYKVPGIGAHVLTSLINAKYPDVPPVNGTTKEFFNNIGDPLPTKLSDAQRTVAEFFNEVVELSHGELNYDDANHILWYTKTVASGREFMMENYSVTFENKVPRRRASSKKPLTHEERVAEAFAHLKAIQEQAARERGGKQWAFSHQMILATSVARHSHPKIARFTSAKSAKLHNSKTDRNNLFYC